MSRTLRCAGAIALVALVVGAIANSGAVVNTFTKAAPKGPVFRAITGPRVAMGTTCDSVSCDAVQSATARCPSGWVATGGGWESDSVTLVLDFAKAAKYSYSVIGINRDSTPAYLKAQVICAKGPGVKAGKALAKARDEDVAATTARVRAKLAK